MRILFIGNSHTFFNDMPALCAELLRASGQKVEITMLTRGGQSLRGHLQNEQTRFNIRYGGYDFVVLQEVTSEFPAREVYLHDVAALKALCDDAGSRCGLYMNFAAPRDTPPLEQMRPAVLEAGRRLFIPVARVGEAFEAAGTRLPELDLYFTDRHHVSPAGAYLIALMIVRDLFDLEVRGLPPLGLPAADAAALQHLAAAL